MTNVNELKGAIQETLEEKGVLNQVRAMMRTAIFEAIESDNKPKPKLTDENLLINELIREYLVYNNYLHANSVFISESGQPVEPPFDRHFIAKELNVLEESSSQGVPLLYSILFGLKKETYMPMPMSMQASNMNPMSMLGQSNTGMNAMNMPMPMQNSSNVFEQKKDQPKPWVIE